jgi:hypothetical protein
MQGNPRQMWTDMPEPVSLEEHAGVLPIDSVTVKAERPATLDKPQDRDLKMNSMVDHAIGLQGSKAYHYLNRNENVGGQSGKWLGGVTAAKCNIFVGDQFQGVGVDVRDPNNRNVYLPAGVWGNRKANIAGFQVLGPKDKLKRGDVISNGHHVGIYAPGPNGEPLTVSAATSHFPTPELTYDPKGSFWANALAAQGDAARLLPPSGPNEVVHNDWGFRGDEGDLVRWRYVGPAGKAGRP